MFVAVGLDTQGPGVRQVGICIYRHCKCACLSRKKSSPRGVFELGGLFFDCLVALL